MAEPIQTLEPQGVEAGDSDNDSTYDDARPSSTISITSSIYNFTEENGRTYHAYEAGKYLMPNDEPEKDRMDIHYHAIRLLFGDRAILAPIGRHPQNIIDQGTGTGIWCMDVGDAYPSAKVIGTDLSPIQPAWVPPGVEFRIDDIEKPWVDADDTFDLVHDRLCSGVAIKDWPAYLAEAFRTTKPGGWVEAQEFEMVALCDDGSLPLDGAVVQWHELFVKGALMAGIDMRVSANKLEGLFKAAGFVNVQKIEFKLPIGPWAKDPKLREAGLLALGGLLEGISGLSIAVFTKLLGWSADELEVLLAKVRGEWKKRSIHQYWPIYVIYGQKPERKKASDDSETDVGNNEAGLTQSQ